MCGGRRQALQHWCHSLHATGECCKSACAALSAPAALPPSLKSSLHLTPCTRAPPVFVPPTCVCVCVCVFVCAPHRRGQPGALPATHLRRRDSGRPQPGRRRLCAHPAHAQLPAQPGPPPGAGPAAGHRQPPHRPVGGRRRTGGAQGRGAAQGVVAIARARVGWLCRMRAVGGEERRVVSE